MDRACSNALWRLRSSDVFGRFHALAPFARGGRPIVAHAKVMVVDDWLARISSANLNNRSHGFDTECELAIAAEAPADRAALAALRDGLAGHWVDRSAAEMAEVRAAQRQSSPEGLGARRRSAPAVRWSRERLGRSASSSPGSTSAIPPTSPTRCARSTAASGRWPECARSGWRSRRKAEVGDQRQVVGGQP